MRAIIFGLFALNAVSTLTAGAFTQEVYVWQRQPSPALAQALDTARDSVAGFDVLGAEIAWSGGQPDIFRAKLDYAHLAKLGRPVGLVLRIGAFSGPYQADDAVAKLLIATAKSLLAEARAGGLTPSELQIDFDCAESKLDGYRVWLGALRAAIGQTPLIFTALPVWLKHEADFAALAKASDGFILQVHSLDKPSGPDSAFTLCDPARALAYAAQASKVGVLFRIALPTYGYLVAFDAAGKFFALAAEGRSPDWPATTQVRAVRADAIAMAQLEQSLAKTPPPHCTGVIWFRLPVAGDQLNWDWATLRVVLDGKTPVSKFTTAVDWPEPGLAEISLVNSGQTTEPPPVQVALAWPVDNVPIAGDGLGGFHLDIKNNEGRGIILNATLSPEVSLAPGSRLKIAWLRFAHEISLSANIVASH
ncbi:MAG TPA: DUF3142 domain-containing protein [Opitutales bacterium]|jgi:hypothetical protein|nr:DUF3142 domain-containing protein [Opitutales bacterium]